MDGLVADAQLVRDLLIHQTLAQQIQHLLFALGQAFRLRLRRRRALERLHDLARDVRRHWRAAAFHFINRFEQFLARRALEHITVRARRQRVENIFRVLIDREHHHLDFRRDFFQLPDALDAVHAGQVDVHQHHVGLGLRQILERVLGVRVIAHAAEAVGAVEHAHERLAQFVAVLDDGNGNHKNC